MPRELGSMQNVSPQYSRPSSPKSSRAVRSITVPHVTLRQVVWMKFSSENGKVKKKLHRYEGQEEEMEIWDEGQDLKGKFRHPWTEA